MKIGDREYKELTTVKEFIAFYKKVNRTWHTDTLQKLRAINEETYQPGVAVYNKRTGEAIFYTLELAAEAKKTGFLG